MYHEVALSAEVEGYPGYPHNTSRVHRKPNELGFVEVLRNLETHLHVVLKIYFTVPKEMTNAKTKF